MGQRNQSGKRRGVATVLSFIGALIGFPGQNQAEQPMPVRGEVSQSQIRRDTPIIDGPPYGGHGEEGASDGNRGQEGATKDESMFERAKEGTLEARVETALEPGHPPEEDEDTTEPPPVIAASSPPGPPEVPPKRTPKVGRRTVPRDPEAPISFLNPRAYFIPKWPARNSMESFDTDLVHDENKEKLNKRKSGESS